MMKCCAILALLAVYVYGAPTGSLSASINANPNGASGTFNSNVNGASGSMSGNFRGPKNVDPITGFKAILQLFAPESWITAFNNIPADGQQCFLKAASDPASQSIYSGDDVEAMKKDLQDKCPTSATQIAQFADATETTYKSLPASFVALAKTWGDSMQALGEQVKQTATSNPGAKGEEAANLYKPYFYQFAKATADFMEKTAELSDADRQQISTAFPKLQAFFSGDQSVNFLKQAAEIYKTLGSGNVDPTALKTQGEQFKQTLKTVWQQYSSANAEGLRQAGQLLGTDLTQAANMMNAQSDAASGAGGFSGFGAAHPQLFNMLNNGAEEENAKNSLNKLNGNNDDSKNQMFNGAPNSAAISASVQ